MSNLDIGSTMQKLLEEFDTKEALTREEISLVQQNIQDLERRILVTEERLKVNDFLNYSYLINWFFKVSFIPTYLIICPRVYINKHDNFNY